MTQIHLSRTAVAWVISFLLATVVEGAGNRTVSGESNDPPYTVEEALADLKSRDKKRVEQALLFLHEPKSLQDQTASVKQEAATALIPFLWTEKKQITFRILGRIGPEAKVAIPHLIKMLRRDSGDFDAGGGAQYVLRRIGKDAEIAIPILIESSARFYFGAFDDPHYRQMLPVTLTAISPNNPMVRKYLRNSLKDENEGVCVTAAYELWNLGERIPEIRMAFTRAQNAEDPNSRSLLAVKAVFLAQTAPEFLSFALARLNDPSEHVRSNTIVALNAGNFLQPEAVEAYRRRLADDDWYIRCCACNGLEKMGRHAIAAVPSLKKCLQDKDGFVRVSCARAIYKIDPSTTPLAVKALSDALGVSGNDIRETAANELAEIGPAAIEALPALDISTRDYSRSIRQAAERAIQKIKKK